MKYFTKILILISILLCLCGCANRTSVREYKSTEIAMGTIVQLNINTTSEQENIVQEVSDIIQNLEQDTLSWRIETSEIAKINQATQQEDSVMITDQLMEYLTTIFEVSRKVKGHLMLQSVMWFDYGI